MSPWYTMEDENYPAGCVARALVPAAPGLLPALARVGPDPCATSGVKLLVNDLDFAPIIVVDRIDKPTEN
jgi:hypothetical protein